MNAGVTFTHSEKRDARIWAAMGIVAFLLVIMLITGAMVVGDQAHKTLSRPTIDLIDPCSPHLLGSQLSPSMEMDLEERCAQQERAMPAQ